jgi:hypothetical protein
MLTFFATMFAAALAVPVLVVCLAVWLAFALIVGLVKLLGWTLRLGFSVLGWLILGTLFLALLDIPFAALVVLIVAVALAVRPAKVA